MNITVRLETPPEVIGDNPGLPWGEEAEITDLDYLHLWHGTAYHDFEEHPQVEGLRLRPDGDWEYQGKRYTDLIVFAR